MAESLADLLYELALANRICGYEGIIDAFGHVSMRHPTDPGRYFLSRSRSPEIVEPADLMEFTLDSKPVKPPTLAMYSERVIHGEIYKARPDVMAVCHHHCPAVLTYCITDEKLRPVYHLGSVMGAVIPVWDQRDEFGDTNLLVREPAEGVSLARALGPHHMVLMRRHGATVVAESLRQLVFRSIYSCRNAEYQTLGKMIGEVSELTPGEIEKAGELHRAPNTVARAWEYWVTRLANRGGMPPRLKAARPAARKSAAKKKSKQGKRR